MSTWKKNYTETFLKAYKKKQKQNKQTSEWLESSFVIVL